MNAMPLMRNLIFAAVLLAVAAFAYGLGRRHATSKSGGITQVATVSPQEKNGVEAAERGKDQEPNHASGILDFYRKCGFERAGKTEPMWIYAGHDH